jgi:hypothetical protein
MIIPKFIGRIKTNILSVKRQKELTADSSRLTAIKNNKKIRVYQ